MKKSTQIIDLSNVINPRVGDDDLLLPLHIVYGDNQTDMRGKDVEFISEDTNKQRIYVGGTCNTNTPGDNLYMGDLTFRFPAGTFKADGAYDPDKTMFRIVDKETQKVISSVNVKITVMKNNIEFDFDPDKSSYDSRAETMLNDFKDKGQAMLDEIKDLKNQANSNVSGDTATTAKEAKKQADQNAGDISDLKGEVAGARGRFANMAGREDAQDAAINQKESVVNANANYAALKQKDAQQDTVLANKAGKFELEDKLAQMNLQPEMYADLDAVKAAYPNGETKLVATDDGYLALYRNGQWIKGPIFQAAGLSEATKDKIEASYIASVADNFVDNATFINSLNNFSAYGTSQHSKLAVEQIDGTNWLVITADQTNSGDSGFSFNIDTKKHTDIDQYPLLLSLLMFSSAQNRFMIVIRYCDANGNELHPKQTLDNVFSINAMSYKMLQESFVLNQKIDDCDHINIAISTLNGFSGLIRVKSLVVTDAYDQELLQVKHKLLDGELLEDGNFSSNKIPNQISPFAVVKSAYTIVAFGNQNFMKVAEEDQTTNNKGFSILISPKDYFGNPYLFQQSVLLTGEVVGNVESQFQIVVRYLDDAWNVLNASVQYGPIINVNGDISSFTIPIKFDSTYSSCSRIAVTLSSISPSIGDVYFTNLSCRILSKNSLEAHDISNTKIAANYTAKMSDELLPDGYFESNADQYMIGDFTSNDKQKYSVVHHDRLNWLSITETDTTTAGKGFSRRIHLADYPNVLEENLKFKLLVWSTANVTFDVHINYMDAAYSVLKTTNITRVTTSFNQIKAKSFEFQLENIENVTDVVIVFSAIGNTIGTTQFAALSLRPTYSEYPDHGLPIVELNDVSSPNAVSQMTDTNQVILDFKLHRNGKVITGYTQSKWQGNSSVSFDKKPYRLKLFSDIALKNKLKINALPSWNADNKFNLKANYNDATFARNVVNARIVRDVMETRTDLPKQLIESTADGQIDGFPVEVYCNGIYHGIHTFNLTKDCFGKAKYAFEGSDYSDLTEFKKVPANADELFTKSNFDMVTPDDPDDTLKQSLTSLLTLCVNATDDDFKTNISNQMDVNSLIDGIILQNLFASTDWVGKNELFVTYDGKKWLYNLYDLDSTWGIGWEGTVNPAVTSIQGTDHGLFGRILKLYEPEIKERYADLRKWLTPNYVLNQFRTFMNSVGQENYERDYELWKEPHFKDQTFAQLKSSVFNQFSVCDKAWLD